MKKGHPRLVKILARLYSHLLQQTVDPFQHILTTLGAYEAIYCSIFGLINPGDQVIIIEPHYDCYVPIVNAAGGVPVFIPLLRHKVDNKTEWRLDFNELESKFSDKTRLIIVNTPQNPLGKVSTCIGGSNNSNKCMNRSTPEQNWKKYQNYAKNSMLL